METAGYSITRGARRTATPGATSGGGWSTSGSAGGNGASAGAGVAAGAGAPAHETASNPVRIAEAARPRTVARLGEASGLLEVITTCAI